MGTRADFYIEKDGKLNWLGSCAWDGYDIQEATKGYKKKLREAKTEEEFLKHLKRYAKERDDWTAPEDGWPWPWNDSCTTDRAYIFRKDHVDIYNFGCFVDSTKTDEENDNAEKWDGFPDMEENRQCKERRIYYHCESKMTDRHSGYIVILEENLREDDAENTISALKQIKNVLDVKPIVSDMSELIAQTRARSELGLQILELLRKP